MLGAAQQVVSLLKPSDVSMAPRRGRERPPDTSVESQDDGFIPVGGRSRSAPGAKRRISTKSSWSTLEKQSADAVDNAQLTFMETQGARYFSLEAERAGLNP